jgi:hypothetical protein
MAGQIFTVRYRDPFLHNPEDVFGSIFATRTIVALDESDRRLEPVLLQALQAVRYVDAKDMDLWLRPPRRRSARNIAIASTKIPLRTSWPRRRKRNSGQLDSNRPIAAMHSGVSGSVHRPPFQTCQGHIGIPTSIRGRNQCNSPQPAAHGESGPDSAFCVASRQSKPCKLL